MADYRKDDIVKSCGMCEKLLSKHVRVILINFYSFRQDDHVSNKNVIITVASFRRLSNWMCYFLSHTSKR